MMYAPVECVSSAVLFAFIKGQKIIQCGQGIGGLVLSNGSESLRCVDRANIYSMPWNSVLGRLVVLEVDMHCIATLSGAHIAARPTPVGSPGMQVKIVFLTGLSSVHQSRSPNRGSFVDA